MRQARTYEAWLRGDTVEWKADRPDMPAGEAVLVRVTIDPPEETEAERLSRGRALREALERPAELDPFREIPDSVEWQREIRKDRTLPGRED